MEYRESPLKGARTIEELVNATAAYLASWTREELECLPDSCRPAWVREAADIEFWADRLFSESAHAALLADHERKLYRMTNHFMVAAIRLRQIAAAA